MRATDERALHQPTPEELMEYLDGEGGRAARQAIAAHLPACASCRSIVAEYRDLADRAHAWTVDVPPASLRPPRVADNRRAFLPPWLLRPRLALLTLSAAAAGLVIVAMSVGEFKRRAPAIVAKSESAPIDAVSPTSERRAAVSAGPPRVAGRVEGRGFAQPLGESAAPVPRVSAVIRTAALRVMAKDFAQVRPQVESLIAAMGGFIDQMTVTVDAGAVRQLHGALRVPSNHLNDALARLRQLGQVVEDTQGSQDVTDQIVDLDARLVNARATEKRLTELLQNRTGRLSDVLEVERELSRVRLDIERLDAEKTNVGRRVSYATIELTVSEERKAGLGAGPLPLGTRLRLAALDGIENVVASAAGALLFVLRAGPPLLFWGILIGLGWFAWRRWRRSPA